MTVTRTDFSRRTAPRQPRQPRQPRAQRKAARIVQAARVCFNRDGFAKTTMARIAREARVSVGTAYAYFRDKQDLLATVLSSHVEELLRPAEAMIAAATPRASLRATLRALLRQSSAVQDAYPGLHRVFHERIIQDARMQEMVTGFRARSRMIIRQLFALHGYRGQHASEAVAEVSLGLLEYCSNIGILYHSPVSREKACAIAADMLDTFLAKK